MQANWAAEQFWRSAIERFTGKAASVATFEKDENLWQVFSFESPPLLVK
jgi:hypothetical protein